MLDLPVAVPMRYPAEPPLFADTLPARFLRNARALPIAIDGETLVLAMADPLDRFIPAAIAAADRHAACALEVAVPIELDAALKRLYPDEDSVGRPPTTPRATPRGRYRAAEGPGERGAGDPAGQPDDRPGGGDPGLGHPHRTVRGPAAGALPL